MEHTDVAGFTERPEASVVDQVMESRRYWDERRSVAHLDTEQMRRQCHEAVQWFVLHMGTTKELLEHDVSHRIGVAQEKFESLAKHPSILKAIASVRNSEEGQAVNGMIQFMLDRAEKVRHGEMKVSDASDSVIDTLGEICYGKPAGNPSEKAKSKRVVS